LPSITYCLKGRDRSRATTRRRLRLQPEKRLDYDMCGIAGAFNFGFDQRPVDRDVVARLNEFQRHRGPDGTGLWSSRDNRVALGHRRLAIIDTSPAGAQPMTDATGRWVITLNGEIYNYRELRAELEGAGRTFLTNSDSEVLINVVAQWGEAGLAKLRGMYAFALWDDVERELWLVRDPYGIKPLYLAQCGGTIWFASQARPLASCAPVDTRREAAALAGFYLWGHVPEPFTWWAGIRLLPAGHLQRVRLGRGDSSAKPFARIEDAYLAHPTQPLAPGELRRLLLETVRYHLVADVPVGVFLSAGIDSNVIAALAAEAGTRLRTVTLAFEEYAGTPDDEAPLAEAAAQALHSDHVTVRIGRTEFEGLLDDFLRSMDQPTIDGLNTYLVSRAAAQQGLKVALSGLGGDELFGGYPSFRQIPKLLKWGRGISSAKAVSRGFRAIMRTVAPPVIPPKAAGLLTHAGDVASAYLLRRALYLEDELDALVDANWLGEGLDKLATHSALSATVPTSASCHAQIAALESCWYMRNQLLRDTDWSSMAHGLEVRVPFVDAALLARLGPAIASAAPPSKRDLAACATGLPRSITDRPKTGFTTPVRQWAGHGTRASGRGLRGWAGTVHRAFEPGVVGAEPAERMPSFAATT
jgi:asparagine synthase (glutamine-hydrolysing)